MAMISRRALLLTGLTGFVAHAGPRTALASANDPLAIINAIYARVARGKGDGGGGFIIESKAAKAKYLSKSLVQLWAQVDAHTPKDEVGPIDFDPVTNSQEPDVKSFKAATENLEMDKAVIAVTITGHSAPGKAADNVIRYHFVRDAGQWKIDDISGSSDGEAWSVRDLLSQSLREVT
jgi:hypothetical protein